MKPQRSNRSPFPNPKKQARPSSMPHQPFVKMQGIGNDFILIDDLAKSTSREMSPITSAYARRICDRRFGVGADQVLWLKPPRNSSEADALMEIVNADGSTAEMCGNGIRAVALYLHKNGQRPGLSQYGIETLAGLLTVKLQGEKEVEVDMGRPWLGSGFATDGEQLVLGPESLKFFEVSVGNPHAVFFVDQVDSIDLQRLGPMVELHPRFPKRTNVEFVQVMGSSELKVRVWERGAGVTLACGTGACASAVAALASGRARGRVAVHLPGGVLQISWEGEGSSVLMEGPAEEVFRGEYTGE